MAACHVFLDRYHTFNVFDAFIMFNFTFFECETLDRHIFFFFMRTGIL